MVDGDPSTPPMATLLENDGTAIHLTVSYTREYGGAYERWFAGNGVSYGDDPNRTKFKYEIPRCLEFEDNLGPTSLVGCRFRSANQQLLSGNGTGRILVEYVVLGGRGGARYAQINGLRSELVGLGDWMGLRSLREETKVDRENRLVSATLHLESPDPVPISNRLNLKVAPSFTVIRSGPDSTTIRERMYVQTHVARARSWDDHLELHQAIRDLVSLSSWRESVFSGISAIRDDDPHRAASGDPRGQKWNPVVATMIDSEAEGDSGPRPLFKYQDVGRSGVTAWVKLRSHFRRGIDPMLTSLYTPASVQSRLAEVGIGFEALAYQMALDDNVPEKTAAWEQHEDRLVRVGDSVELPLPFTIAEWAERTSQAYNGIKHANRAEVDIIDALNAWRESVLVFRAWVATRIGATSDAVVERLQFDRMTFPYEAS